MAEQLQQKQLQTEEQQFQIDQLKKTVEL